MPMLEYIGGDPPIGKRTCGCIPTRPGNTRSVEIQRVRVRRYLRGCAWLNRLNLSFADDDGLIVFWRGARAVDHAHVCQCNNPRISSYELSIGRRLRKRVHETTEEQGKNGVLFIGHKIAEPAARP